MNKVIELQKAIVSTLTSVHPRVYSERAPDKAIPPFLVYDLPNSVDDGSMERFILDVDGWDTPADGITIPLDTMMDAVDAALHRKTVVVNDQLAMTFYRENRFFLKDDDPRIFRRQYTYQVRTFEREA